MAHAIWHPGIETEYVFETWEEARTKLEQRHGGLASGMLASCVEIELTDTAEELESAGVECQGREWADTRLQQMRQGVSTLYVSEVSRGELEHVLELDPNEVARWYYTDAVGNATLLCWQAYEDE